MAGQRAANGIAPEIAEPERIQFDGALAGYHILVDPDALDVGFLEDLESTSIKIQLDTLARAIVGGSLPHGTDRAGLRRLKPAQLVQIALAIVAGYRVPKRGEDGVR